MEALGTTSCDRSMPSGKSARNVLSTPLLTDYRASAGRGEMQGLAGCLVHDQKVVRPVAQGQSGEGQADRQ